MDDVLEDVSDEIGAAFGAWERDPNGNRCTISAGRECVIDGRAYHVVASITDRTLMHEQDISRIRHNAEMQEREPWRKTADPARWGDKDGY